MLNKTFLRLQDEKPQTLCQYSGKVVLVNTASKCGFAAPVRRPGGAFTPKYKGPRPGFVLGFPSADFMRQEYDSGQQIAEFCQNTYGVEIPDVCQSHGVGD